MIHWFSFVFQDVASILCPTSPPPPPENDQNTIELTDSEPDIIDLTVNEIIKKSEPLQKWLATNDSAPSVEKENKNLEKSENGEISETPNQNEGENKNLAKNLKGGLT